VKAVVGAEERDVKQMQQETQVRGTGGARWAALAGQLFGSELEHLTTEEPSGGTCQAGADMCLLRWHSTSDAVCANLRAGPATRQG